MEIKTKSFTLSALVKGEESSSKLAIVLPGRLDSKEYAHTFSHVDYLSKNGFYSITFDPPGTWDSDGPIDIYTTTNYIKAVNELIEYFGNRETLLVGFSRGGATSMLCASNPSVIGIAVTMATFGNPTPPSEEDIQRGFKLSNRDMPPGDKKTKEQKEFKLPITYFEDGNQYNPLAELINLRKPKLIVYGNKDEFTKPEDVREAYSKMPNPKMIFEVDSKHDYRYDPEKIKKINGFIGEFLDKHIKTSF